jgi:hypothetical protein
VVSTVPETLDKTGVVKTQMNLTKTIDVDRPKKATQIIDSERERM